MDGNRVLTINAVNLNDTARYTCVGTNIAGELSNHVDLQIFGSFTRRDRTVSVTQTLDFRTVPPTIQRDPDKDNVSVIQHHHIALTCTAQGKSDARRPDQGISDSRFSQVTHGLPYRGKRIVFPSIHSILDTGTQFDHGDDFIETFAVGRIGPAGFQLLIIQADPSQAGIYTCLAYSKAGEVKQQFRLTVLGTAQLWPSSFLFLHTSQSSQSLDSMSGVHYFPPTATRFGRIILLRHSSECLNIE